MRGTVAKRLYRAAIYIADKHKAPRHRVYKAIKKDYLALPWKERAGFKEELPG